MGSYFLLHPDDMGGGGEGGLKEGSYLLIVGPTLRARRATGPPRRQPIGVGRFRGTSSFADELRVFGDFQRRSDMMG